MRYLLFVVVTVEDDLRQYFLCLGSAYALPTEGQGAFIEMIPGIFGKRCFAIFVCGDIFVIIDDNISFNISEFTGVNEFAEVFIGAVLIEDIFTADIGMPIFLVDGLQY